MGPGANVIKLFTAVIYEARVFVPSKIFQPSMMFVVKQKPTLLKNLSDAPLYGRLTALPTNIRFG